MVRDTALEYVTFKLRKNLARRGLAGTLWVCVCKLRDVVRSWAPRERRLQRREREFDRTHEVKTAHVVPLDDLDASERAAFGNPYQATPAGVLPRILNSLPIDHAQFVFVDLGSGMGRVVLEASEFPFQRIIGVEFSATLHRIALQNLQSFKDEHRRCRAVELVCMDAAEYPLPAQNTIVYLFNAFGRPTVERVVDNLRRSLERHAREVLIVYYHPEHADVLDASPFLERLKRTEARPGQHALAIYRNKQR